MTRALGSEPKRQDYIDCLRGFAILGVLAIHARLNCPDVPDWLLVTAGYGEWGVQLFFMLSALTLMTVYSHQPISFKNFLTRRFFRIAPMFYLAIPLYLALDGTLPRFYAPHGIHWPQIALTLTFLNSWTPDSIDSVVPGGWSIGDEAMFYLIFPLLLLYLTNLRRSVIALILAFIFALAVRYTVAKLLLGTMPIEPLGYYTMWFFPHQLPAFIIGFVAFYLIRWLRENPTQFAFLRQTFGILTLYAFIILMLFLGVVETEGLITHSYQLNELLLLLLTVSVAISQFKLIVNPIMSYIGRISYSLYILHFMFNDHITAVWVAPYVQAHNWDPTLQFAAAFGIDLALSMLAATATYYLIERPFIRLGHRLTAA